MAARKHPTEDDASEAIRLALGGIRTRRLRPRQCSRSIAPKSHYALAAAAMICAGIQPGLLDEVIWWPHNDLRRFALYALVIYGRVASERIGEEPATIARRIAAGRHVHLPRET